MISLPTPRPITPRFSAQLNCIRWVAALLVCTSHLRSLCLVDYDAAVHTGWVARSFYILHGYGHEAVMVFFVLSGYLIGGEVLRCISQKRQNWRNYALRRCARLYAVYFAALLLGGLLDRTGLWLFHDTGMYTGQVEIPMIFYNVSARLNTLTIAGNLIFSQTVIVPSLGSNVPLWSMANEAWYYVLFPLVLASFFQPDRLSTRLSRIFALAAVAWFVRGPLLEYFSVWLLGVLVHIPTKKLLAYPGLALVPLSIGLLLNRLHWLDAVPLLARDLGLGLLFALTLQALSFSASETIIPGATTHRALAGFSYSLYLIHWPVAFCTVAALQHYCGVGLRAPFSVSGVLCYAAILAMVYTMAWMVARQTEARTVELRNLLAPLFGVARSSSKT